MVTNKQKRKIYNAFKTILLCNKNNKDLKSLIIDLEGILVLSDYCNFCDLASIERLLFYKIDKKGVDKI